MKRRYLLDGGAVGNDGAGVAENSQKMLGKCEDAVQNVHDVQAGWVMSVWIVWWTRHLTRTRASGLLTIAINGVHSALYA